MLSYNLEYSDLSSPLGVKAHSTQGLVASKAFPVLQRCRVVYASHIRQGLDKDLRATPGSSFSCHSCALPHQAGICKSGGVDILFPLHSMQLEFLEGDIPGYVCNHGSPRERDAASQGHTSGIPTRAMLHS